MPRWPTSRFASRSSAGRVLLTPRPAALAHALAMATLAFASACTLGPSPPAVTRAEPAWGYNGEDTDIEIVGEHFFPTVILSGWEGNDGRVEGTFQAWLEGDEPIPLTGVEHISYERLRAQVPAGISPGIYDLGVEMPSGLTATLADGFTVTDTRADHLDLSVSTAAYTVGDPAPITIRVLDPNDAPVAQPLDVTVTAASLDDPDATAVTFVSAGLGDAETSDDGTSVSGTLGADGSGTVLVSSDHPDDVTLAVAPTDTTSVVRGDSLVLSWDPGSVTDVELTLPRDDYQVTAGVPFTLGIALRDTFGNLLSTQPADIVLTDACGGLIDPDVSIVGSGTRQITLTAACDSDVISAYAFGTSWTSATFAVLPATTSAFEVQAAPSTVSAGLDPLVVLVRAVDPWGNVVPTYTGELSLSDSAGGLDPTHGVGVQSCRAFVEGAAVCTAELWAATDDDTILVRSGGVTGSYASVDVVPADPSSVLVLSSSSTVEAGEAFTVVVRAIDAWGNTVDYDPGGTDPVAFTDDSGTIACDWAGPDGGAQSFLCTIEGAVDDAHVEARVLGLSGELTDPLAVTNAALAVVDLDPLATTFIAGAAFTLDVRGSDIYGNPYLVQTDPLVDLSDGSTTFTPTSAVLSTTGAVQVSATVRVAGQTVRVQASQGGTLLGTSRSLVVSAGALDSLAVAAPPWIAAGDPTDVVVTAEDAYGNAIPTYAGPVTLTAKSDACASSVVDVFAGGSATVAVTCDTPTLSETLAAADDAGFTGESGVVDVVDLACANGPTAALLVDGASSSIRCVASGGVDVAVDASHSVAGSAGITVYHFRDRESEPERTLASSTTYTYSTAGTRYVEVLTVDSRACADLAGAYVYVGEDDGEPTGPVTVTPSAGTVASSGSVTVDVAATDCTGDVAAGQPLLVRADLGEPGGTASGEGLGLTLDASGEGSFTWSFTTGYAGTAAVWAGTADGGAWGNGSLTVTGDSVLPQVVETTPSGVDLDTVRSISVLFDEPMYSAQMTSYYISLTGPTGTIAATYQLSSDLTTLTVTPVAPFDGSAGVYTFGLSRNIRDLAGNQLDGEWSGARAAYTVTFGDVGSALPDVSSCVGSVARFVPDGDDGADEEADSVTVTPTATATPTWWWLQVVDEDGVQVRSLREPGTTAAASWDGRGDDGIVVSAGDYEMTLSPVDSYGNIGEGCDVAVELDQHVDAP